MATQFARNNDDSLDNAALEALCNTAAANRGNALPYSGEVMPREAHDYLASQGGLLVDVRTLEEWSGVGMPDMAGTKGDAAFISWKTNPGYMLNPHFLEQLATQPISADTPLFFLCRSGGRSLDAAIAAMQAGYKYAFNVTGGFEGEQGWQAAKLPVKQGAPK